MIGPGHRFLAASPLDLPQRGGELVIVTAVVLSATACAAPSTRACRSARCGGPTLPGMDNPPYRVTVRNVGATVAVIDVEGLITAVTARSFLAEAEPAVAAPTRLLVIHFAALEYCDSAGLGAILALVRRARAGGGQVALVRLDDSLRQVFEMTGLDRVLNIYDTEAEAITAFGAT